MLRPQNPPGFLFVLILRFPFRSSTRTTRTELFNVRLRFILPFTFEFLFCACVFIHSQHAAMFFDVFKTNLAQIFTRKINNIC